MVLFYFVQKKKIKQSTVKEVEEFWKEAVLSAGHASKTGQSAKQLSIIHSV